MGPIRRGLRVGLLVAAAVAGGVPPAAWGIQDGEDVPAAVIPSTGAVYFTTGGCSGMLLTPWWVLTAGHCGAEGGFAYLANAGNWNAPHATVLRTFTHWNYQYGEAEYDVRLVQLEQPLYPRFPNGAVWSTYKRDLYRDDIRALAGGHADVYGYGATDDQGTGRGILRYAWFRIDGVGDHIMEIDGHVEVWGGDSGAAVLVEAQYGVTATDAYQIAAVVSSRGPWPDHDGHAAHAESIAPWFDSIVGDTLRPFDKPALIMTILGVR